MRCLITFCIQLHMVVIIIVRSVQPKHAYQHLPSGAHETALAMSFAWHKHKTVSFQWKPLAVAEFLLVQNVPCLYVKSIVNVNFTFIKLKSLWWFKRRLDIGSDLWNYVARVSELTAGIWWRGIHQRRSTAENEERGIRTDFDVQKNILQALATTINVSASWAITS